MKSINDCYTLSNGVEIPCIGFGTYKAAEKDNADIIRMAIDAGYRYFDTASFYGTESFVAKAIESSGIKREKFFLTSKVWKDEMGYEATKKALERTLWNLKTDYLDLYLIHWPLPTPDSKDWKELDIATWKAMEELYKEGKVRAIGLSNFLPHHIMNIQKNCEVEPMVNQIEFHPGYTQEAVLRFCRENDILVQAWSPLGRQRVLKDALVTELAEKYQVSSARLCLRFALQKGVIPLPKASAMERMKENQDIFSFNIEETDMYRLETMPQTGWSGEHPDRVRMVLN
ncbi:MAG: aldo/keto reductase [Lachnospiraceae bacterium]|uniref:aldo/keto reductase family protein n=1 Tax=Roseburia hominis TaxID=301301 RepID=UPI001F311DD7|nr:aldo/keto reductase [Roseburia hominis]MCI5712626.1 aldo/keto reductase [Lachnospiraceae bacterium]MDD6170376.1 aldo/keto reductase [Lachnospiraceae bacterium]MDY4838088.1 aldo/keto reductase [Lachnospiraceae bacterium]